MNRNNKIAIILAAIIIPGGFVALLSAWLLKRASETERGRKALESARARGASLRGMALPAWLTQAPFSTRQAA